MNDILARYMKDISGMELDEAAAWFEKNKASGGLLAEKEYSAYLMAKEQEAKAFEIISSYASDAMDAKDDLHDSQLVDVARSLFVFGTEAMTYLENGVACDCFEAAALLYGKAFKETKDDDALLLQYQQDVARQMVGDNISDVLKWQSIENGIATLVSSAKDMSQVSRAFATSLIAKTYAVRAKVYQTALMNSTALDFYMNAMRMGKEAGEVLRKNLAYAGMIDVKASAADVYIMLSDGYSSLGNLFMDFDPVSSIDSLESALKAIDIARNELYVPKDSLLLFECNTYSRLALCHMRQDKDAKAAEYVEKAIALQKEACQLFDLEFVYTELCLSYYSACSIFESLKQPEKVMEYGKAGLAAYEKGKEAGEEVPDQEIYNDLKRYASGKKKGFLAKLFGA